MTGLAVVLGCMLGVGLWSVAAVVPRVGARRLSERIAPYLLDVSEEARQLTERRVSDPLPVLGRLLSPVVGRAVRALSALLGGNVSVEKWLAQAGWSLNVQQFRVRQVLLGGAGIVAGSALGVVFAQNGRPMAGVAMPFAVAAAAVVGCDVYLRRRAASRVTRISEEVPTVLEFLSLSLSAGEGIVDALRRIARIGSGELSVEVRLTLVDISAGVPVAVALTRCAARVGSPSLTRAVEQMRAAMEHGSPIAQVLRAQAQDARDDLKRSLLEAAGRKEVAMLVPLVLLILPLSIAFALLPGIFVLRAGF
ncbi:type II secretion system F family protein [Microbacterium sp. MPKO10]|uniref:type II secretion system F family protein n=1 Tax=Microbacterium sp. MPKO10 TaxID=2989818 RepID=UPI002236BAB0|nr:type II secretion system F family protein [Microbacterium sp. MPKO10]MCW4458141.1 type II secretion system F family protein [Microbacterium sp. MPKO10]